MAKEDEVKITLARLEAMPINIKLSIGNYGSFNKWELREHVEKNDEIGELVTQLIMTNLRAMKNKYNSL